MTAWCSARSRWASLTSASISPLFLRSSWLDSRASKAWECAARTSSQRFVAALACAEAAFSFACNRRSRERAPGRGWKRKRRRRRRSGGKQAQPATKNVMFAGRHMGQGTRRKTKSPPHNIASSFHGRAIGEGSTCASERVIWGLPWPSRASCSLSRGALGGCAPARPPRGPAHVSEWARGVGRGA